MTSELSLRLYAILDKVGASEKMRRRHIFLAKASEVFRTIKEMQSREKRTSVYYCGSQYEGSVTPGLASDTDVLYCNDDMPIVHEANAGQTGNYFLLIIDENTCPGYVKLQCVKRGFPLNIYISDGAEHCRADRLGRYCLSNSATTIRFYGDHGPAFYFSNSFQRETGDFVGAFALKQTPDVYKRKHQQQGKYGWPSESQLRKISKFGCLVVGVGNSISKERDIEWRLSFTLAERYLMTELTTVQHKVYILLKMVIRSLLRGGEAGSKLTSYHCKMCIFHLVENTPSRIWNHENLVNCLLSCLSLLLRWVQVSFCPDYFISDCNLFSNRYSRRTRQDLAGTLRTLLAQGQRIFMRLRTDNIGQMLQGPRLYNEIAISESAVMEFKIKWNFLNVCSVKFQLLSEPYEPENLIKLLDDITRYVSALDEHDRCTSKAVAYITPWINLHLALCMASRFCSRRPALSTIYKSIRQIDDHLDKARRADLVASSLGKATILLKFKKLEACLRLLQSVEDKLTPNVLTHCTCHSDRRSNRLSKQQILRTSDMSIQTMLMTSVASCIVFLPSEKNIIPEPLNYELIRSTEELSEPVHFWFKWAVVDAKVYLFYLQYVVNSLLHRRSGKKRAIDNLNGVVDTDVNLGHKETAYNLLGWIYKQENRHDKASQCFRTSLEIRPTHNAAKLLVKHSQ